ncbi:hypothetical protein NQ317_013089 [Molorchus minor]|uniref:Uncharacterized protein n=1 Tax=Molorchus minor TaxID=1323400 RepID=A0ABQ9J0X9_9CUCU|nr:hypothetical protein NQ317_013089 [Molorchus minor]
MASLRLLTLFSSFPKYRYFKGFWRYQQNTILPLRGRGSDISYRLSTLAPLNGCNAIGISQIKANRPNFQLSFIIRTNQFSKLATNESFISTAGTCPPSCWQACADRTAIWLGLSRFNMSDIRNHIGEQSADDSYVVLPAVAKNPMNFRIPKLYRLSVAETLGRIPIQPLHCVYLCVSKKGASPLQRASQAPCIEDPTPYFQGYFSRLDRFFTVDVLNITECRFEDEIGDLGTNISADEAVDQLLSARFTIPYLDEYSYVGVYV